MSKAKWTLIVLTLMVLFTGMFAVLAQDKPSGLPKRVELTQTELLLVENAQLKINDLQRQQIEVLRGALRNAGIAEVAWDKYQLTQDGKGFVLKDEPAAPAAPTAKKDPVKK